MIINFEHRCAAHCETGVVSNMLNFYGYQMSESMVFGIGEGLTFIYIPFLSFKGNSLKFSFRSFPGSIFSCVTKKLHIKVGMKRFFNKKTAMQEMDNLIAEGTPVGNVVGLYYLPYSPVRAHFNAHNLCVVGKEGNDYIISDPCWHDTLLNISYDELMKVRFPKGAFKPRGKMYWIMETATLPDINHLILSSIKRTCTKMIGFQMLTMLGIRGIKFLSQKIRSLETRYNEKDRILYLASLVQAIEEIGTGGAGYRYMYATFLYEAANTLNNPNLQNFRLRLPALVTSGGNLPSNAYANKKTLQHLSYNELADMVLHIATEEKKFFVALKKYVITEYKK